MDFDDWLVEVERALQERGWQVRFEDLDETSMGEAFRAGLSAQEFADGPILLKHTQPPPQQRLSKSSR